MTVSNTLALTLTSNLHTGPTDINGSSNVLGYRSASIVFWPSAPANRDIQKVSAVDLFLLVQMDAEAEEMRAKPKGVKSVFIILTQWPATQVLRLCTFVETDNVCLCMYHVPSALEEQWEQTPLTVARVEEGLPGASVGCPRGHPRSP